MLKDKLPKPNYDDTRPSMCEPIRPNVSEPESSEVAQRQSSHLKSHRSGKDLANLDTDLIRKSKSITPDVTLVNKSKI